ncbi:hypothetical protein SKAU_G00186640 [Synaphobranchus kaupii]|uniref:DNA-dependent metalloprotease SPRTN n=1 Tax=Synaphobranchus kaupii TaxID=118154 RepID=A0A9Q1IX13_SYNKA|nr:hypothetical protein SKAU_G00186640 [Synaphobranchus kaupii]
MDEDFLLAVQLQEQFNYEASTSSSDVVDLNVDPVSKKRKVDHSGDVVAPYYSSFEPERPMSIVDESWETLDPSPDVRAMFLQFNDMFFWGKLFGVEVKWSPRMTLCAGVCSYEGRGGLCSIRLSEPLLKLRPRRDLVQTLLHEMIHALLFVTQNNRDRDGHGPEFCKHMDRINKASGTKITVYHTFHDEVDQYRQHWWRCNGPCQTRKPYFGYVKRAMNRAPSAQDLWWADHQRTCGGTYTKIKEPDDYGKKGKKGDDKDTKAPSKPNSKPSTTTTGKSGSQDIRNVLPFSGRGFVLGGSSQSSSSQKPPDGQRRLHFPDPPKPPGSPLGQLTAKAINSTGPPGHGSPHRMGNTATLTSTSRGPQSDLPSLRPPSKKSVANSRAFVNINGSPVRITKTTGHLTKPLGNSTDSTNVTQRSVRDLFNAKVLVSPDRAGMSASASSASKPANGITGQYPDVSWERSLDNGLNWKAGGQPGRSGNAQSQGRSSGLQSGSPGGSGAGLLNTLDSKRPKSPAKPAAAIPVSRKRPWDSRGTAHIFDFFQRTMSESSSPKGKREGVAATLPTPTPTVRPAPVSSVSPTVSCPVCQVTVPASKINEHLDSCLA